MKEEAVDPLLVADLVYDVAVKILDYAFRVGVDTDFPNAITSAEDFGCRISILEMCADVPVRFAREADEVFSPSREGRCSVSGLAVPRAAATSGSGEPTVTHSNSPDAILPEHT